MNMFEMVRKAIVNDMIESTPPRVVLETQLEVILQQADELAEQARELREDAEALLRRLNNKH